MKTSGRLKRGVSLRVRTRAERVTTTNDERATYSIEISSLHKLCDGSQLAPYVLHHRTSHSSSTSSRCVAAPVLSKLHYSTPCFSCYSRIYSLIDYNLPVLLSLKYHSNKGLGRYCS